MSYCLFGAGDFGAHYYQHLKDIVDIVCFCDNDTKRHNSMFQGLPVISPKELSESGIDVIVSTNVPIDIIRQLFEMGIKKSYVWHKDNRTHESDIALTAIDLTEYEVLCRDKNKVCLLSHGLSGAGTYALQKIVKDSGIEFIHINDAALTTEQMYHLLTAAFIIVSHHQVLTGVKSINLWHGFPLKALGFISKDKKEVISAVRYSISFNKHELLASYSPLYSILMGYSYNIPISKFALTGNPRNDLLFLPGAYDRLQKIIGSISQHKIIIYSPTFREAENQLHGSKGYIFNMPGFCPDKLNLFLRENDALLLCKFHPSDFIAAPDFESENIRLLTDGMFTEKDVDFYEILSAADILITDYSSIYIDYLLLDKPIVFTPVDLESYHATKGFSLEPYEEWVPGDIAVEFSDFLNSIKDGLTNPDKYHSEREHIRKITHTYNDGNSTNRVIELIRRCLSEDV